MIIPLTKGKFALIDDDDFEKLIQYKWHCSSLGYAEHRIPSTMKMLKMHRVVNGTPDGLMTDHINGNRLDNRKSNLRNCDRSQNLANSSRRKDNKSGYKGVLWDKRERKWIASIRVNGKLHFLGRYVNIKVAAQAYSEAANKHFGEFAKT